MSLNGRRAAGQAKALVITHILFVAIEGSPSHSPLAGCSKVFKRVVIPNANGVESISPALLRLAAP
jgi:hypothetical protein